MWASNNIFAESIMLKSLRIISFVGYLAVAVAGLYCPVWADGTSEVDEESTRSAAPDRKHHLPRPPGSLSEDGDMKVWDTRGPVEISPHVPSVSIDERRPRNDTELHLPSGVIVDMRENGVYPGADPSLDRRGSR